MRSCGMWKRLASRRRLRDAKLRFASSAVPLFAQEAADRLGDTARESAYLTLPAKQRLIHLNLDAGVSSGRKRSPEIGGQSVADSPVGIVAPHMKPVPLQAVDELARQR